MKLFPQLIFFLFLIYNFTHIFRSLQNGIQTNVFDISLKGWNGNC